MMEFLLVIYNCILAFIVYRFEKSALSSSFPGPVTIFLSILVFLYIQKSVGVFSFSNTDFTRVDILYAVYNTVFSVAALAIYGFLGPVRRLPQFVLPERYFTKFVVILCLFGFVGYVLNFYRVYQFGLVNALTFSGGFHTWSQQQSITGGPLVRLVRTMFVSPQIIGFCLGIVMFRYSSSAVKKFLSIYFALFFLQLLVYGGRGAFVTGIFTLIWSLLFLKRLSLKQIKLKYVFLLFIVLFVITLKRTSHRGDYAYETYFTRYGIERTVLPEAFLKSSVGLFFVEIFSYSVPSYGNYSAIANNLDDFKQSLGTRSFRLLNPLTSQISPKIARIQKTNHHHNMSIINQFFIDAGDQWTTLYGYLLLDFGVFGCGIYVMFNGMVLAFLSSKAARLTFWSSLATLVICYSWSFSSFVMPFTAMYGGLLRLFIFLIVVLLAVGRSRRYTEGEYNQG